MITVVRLERRGNGIFRPSNRSIYNSAIAKRTYARHNGGSFPLPEAENLNMFKGYRDWFCAYKTIEQLQAWIHKDEIDFFISKGFKVLMLDVEEYQEGEMQVIFTKESIISSKDVTSLFL